MPIGELAEELAATPDLREKQWFLLALGTNTIQHDPHQVNTVIQRWFGENMDHPARSLIEQGLLVPGWESNGISKIILLLPLSSSQSTASQVFLDGFQAQYSADSSPDKPLLEIIDIGSNPLSVVQFYYDALDRGADFVIGPLGTRYVKEMAAHGVFVVPTLLLGNAGEAMLPDFVYQFTLAPEEDAASVARRARSDGHVTALTLTSETSWSERELHAFTSEWERLGGSIIHSEKFNPNDGQYMEVVKELLNIETSTARYSALREITPRKLKFTPRRRKDADFIFLSTTSQEGRLIKPHLDFLRAYDLPVYTTSRIFTGNFNELEDQDLNGIRFTDMNWMIDQNSNMMNLRRKLGSGKKHPLEFERVFAFGIDTYNLVNSSQLLRLNPDARHHGVTAMLSTVEDGKVTRNPLWVEFVDGHPKLIVRQPDPEALLTSIDYTPNLQEPLPERQ